MLVLVPIFATWHRIGKRREAVKIRGRTHCIGGIGRFNLKLVHRGSNRLCALEKIGVYGLAV